MIERPDFQPTATGIADLWTSYHSLEDKRKADEYTHCLQRQRVLLLNMAAWEWLQETSFRAAHDHRHWLFGLGTRVRDSQLAKNEITLSRADHFPNMNPQSGTTTFTFKPKRYSASKPFSPSSTVFDILAIWLGFPETHKFRPKAWFARTMLQHMGPSSLLLDAVWKAACNLSQEVFVGRHPLKSLTADHFTEWGKNVLALSPSCQADTQEMKLLAVIDSKLLQALHPPPLSNSTAPRSRVRRRTQVVDDNDDDSGDVSDDDDNYSPQSRKCRHLNTGR
jgi:hypothetical protein